MNKMLNLTVRLFNIKDIAIYGKGNANLRLQGPDHKVKDWGGVYTKKIRLQWTCKKQGYISTYCR